MAVEPASGFTLSVRGRWVRGSGHIVSAARRSTRAACIPLRQLLRLLHALPLRFLRLLQPVDLEQPLARRLPRGALHAVSALLAALAQRADARDAREQAPGEDGAGPVAAAAAAA
jgi:hypothetical protein